MNQAAQPRRRGTWECGVTPRGIHEDTGTEAQRCSESHIYLVLGAGPACAGIHSADPTTQGTADTLQMPRPGPLGGMGHEMGSEQHSWWLWSCCASRPLAPGPRLWSRKRSHL